MSSRSSIPLGAHRVLFWSTADGADAPQAFSALQDAITVLGGSPNPNKWLAQSTAHKPTTDSSSRDNTTGAQRQQLKELYIVKLPVDSIHASQDDHTIFVNPQDKKVIEVDSRAKSLLDGFKAFKPKNSLTLEGFSYTAGDTRFTLAKCMQRPSNDIKGIAIIIEYLPTIDPYAAAAVLKELEIKMREAAHAAVVDAYLVALEEAYDDYCLLSTTKEHSILHLAVQCVGLTQLAART